MTGLSSVSSTLLHDQEDDNFKTLFACSLDILIADHDLFNKFVIYKFTQYIITNTEDFCFWNSIQMDFAEFEVKYFDELDIAT